MSAVYTQYNSFTLIVGRNEKLPVIPDPANKVTQTFISCYVVVTAGNRHSHYWPSLNNNKKNWFGYFNCDFISTIMKVYLNLKSIYQAVYRLDFTWDNFCLNQLSVIPASLVGDISALKFHMPFISWIWRVSDSLGYNIPPSKPWLLCIHDAIYPNKTHKPTLTILIRQLKRQIKQYIPKVLISFIIINQNYNQRGVTLYNEQFIGIMKYEQW